MYALFVRGFAIVLALFVLSACERATPPPLITVTEFAPSEAEVGDRLEVAGTGFPKGKPARMTFKGTLHRPGEPPAPAEIEAAATVTSAEHVEFGLTEALEAMFCGRGDRALHTTFRGEVEIAFPAVAAGAPPVAATLGNVTLDLRPASAPPALAAARRAEAERALAFLGLALDPARAAGGLAVRTVTPGSRADAAGLAAGDVVTSFDGVRAIGLEDMVPSGARARVTLGFRRGDLPEALADLAIDGYRFSAPRDLVPGALVLLLATGAIAFFCAPGAGLLAWLERRLAMRLRALDARALLRHATSARAPMFAAAAASLLFAILPFGRYVVIADLDIGLFFLVALTSLATIGFLTGGWRGAAQIASFEVPAALAIASVVLMTGSTRLHEIVRAQGGAPWSFYAFRTPATFLLFVLHFSGALAQSTLVPAPLGEAEGEPRPAPRGPLARRVSRVAEWANVAVTAGTGAALFLGGWRLPGMTLGQQNGELLLELAGSALFVAKAAVLAGAIVLVRRALPVVRVEMTMRLCWRWLVPLALVALAATACWTLLGPSGPVERILAIGTCALFALALVRLVVRVRYAARLAPADAPTSVFL